MCGIAQSGGTVEYGEIIKQAWRITWRYKALWVLGVFAGVSGCQSGGSSGGGGRGGGEGFRDFSSTGMDFDGLSQVPEMLAQLVPLLIALGIVVFMMGVVWLVFGVAARGGLVTAVSEIEEGRQHGLGTLWGAGFKRFWSVLGLEILMSLPVLLVTLVMLYGIFAPLAGSLFAGQAPGAEVVAPIFGSLCVGVPVLIVLSLLLGVLRLIAMRYIMLGGQGAFEAIGNSWRFFRVRIKDTVLMYLVNAGLNLVAGIALAIPAVIISVAAVVPVVMAASDNNWGAITAPIVIGVVALILLSLLYTGIWGTYTSALWTLFFRRVAGMQPAMASSAPSGGGFTAPAAPEYPPAPSGPPIAGYEQPPVVELPPPPDPPAGDQTPPTPASAAAPEYPSAPPVQPPGAEPPGASDEQG
jgi:hypothetical protein